LRLEVYIIVFSARYSDWLHKGGNKKIDPQHPRPLFSVSTIDSFQCFSYACTYKCNLTYLNTSCIPSINHTIVHRYNTNRVKIICKSGTWSSHAAGRWQVTRQESIIDQGVLHKLKCQHNTEHFKAQHALKWAGNVQQCETQPLVL
jgi:hypothetical protein